MKLPLFGGKRMKPEEFSYLVALRARQYIPRIEAFVEYLVGGDFSSQESRKAIAIEAESMFGNKKFLSKAVDGLDDRAPYKIEHWDFRSSLGFGMIGVLSREPWEAFIEGKEKAAGKIVVRSTDLLVHLLASLCFLLIRTMSAMRMIDIRAGPGIPTIKTQQEWLERCGFNQDDYRPLAKVLGEDVPKTGEDFKTFRPIIRIIKRELEQFPSNEELERLLAK